MVSSWNLSSAFSGFQLFLSANPWSISIHVQFRGQPQIWGNNIYIFGGLSIKAFSIFRCSGSSKFDLQTRQASKFVIFLLELWPLSTLWTGEFVPSWKKSSKHSSYPVHLHFSRVESLPVLPDLSCPLASLNSCFLYFVQSRGNTSYSNVTGLETS